MRADIGADISSGLACQVNPRPCRSNPTNLAIGVGFSHQRRESPSLSLAPAMAGLEQPAALGQLRERSPQCLECALHRVDRLDHAGALRDLSPSDAHLVTVQSCREAAHRGSKSTGRCRQRRLVARLDPVGGFRIAGESRELGAAERGAEEAGGDLG